MWMTLLIVLVISIVGGLLAIFMSNKFDVIENLVDA